MESIGDGFKRIGELDISLKIGGAIAIAAASFGTIAIPTNQQKEESAIQLYSRPMSKLTPQEKKAAGDRVSNIHADFLSKSLLALILINRVQGRIDTLESLLGG